ncbi:hypothetical protein GALL_472130 [mine drainage metagenome]|uniref:Uncharacterized protein n=1 Tax=mine drainage metagenome TaxID=410659 RepID=A0A1J5PI67_9ZZZZ
MVWVRALGQVALGVDGHLAFQQPLELRREGVVVLVGAGAEVHKELTGVGHLVPPQAALDLRDLGPLGAQQRMGGERHVGDAGDIPGCLVDGVLGAEHLGVGHVAALAPGYALQHQEAPLGRADAQARGLAHHGAVQGSELVEDGGEARAAGLLLRREGHHHLALEGLGGQLEGREKDGGHAALGVVGAQALEFVGARRALGEQGRIQGLHGHHQGSGLLAGQHLADAGDGPARADARHEGIQLRHLGQHFQGGCAPVGLNVGGVVELPHQEVGRIARGQHLGLLHSALHAQAPGGEDQFGAIGLQQGSALLGHGVRHHQGGGITLGRGHEGQPHARVAAGGLDHRLAGLELAGLLGRLDDPQRQAVLDRAQGIEGLDLDPEVHTGRPQAVDAHHRGAADGLQNALIFGHGVVPLLKAAAP